MPSFERDGSYYGRERVTREISVEKRELVDGDQVFRFLWDGPKLQPFAGEWRSVKNQAIQDGADWLESQRIYIEEDVTDRRAVNEHSSGAACAEVTCPKPATFDTYCAKHYCVRMAVNMGVAIRTDAP